MNLGVLVINDFIKIEYRDNLLKIDKNNDEIIKVLGILSLI